MNVSSDTRALRAQAGTLLPGLVASAVTGVAAMFLSEHYGAPVMLFALLLGMAMNFLSQQDACAAGIDFTASHLLRLGVALLGLRITAEQVVALGWKPLALVAMAVVLTIGCGVLLARAMRYRTPFGLLTGGAVAICGASAAMALSAVLPQHPMKERATLLTVVGVCVLSTMAMVIYPLVTQWLGMTPREAGFFLGGTIHDIAQVVGAGYSLSADAGSTATLVKLMRVAMLVPVIAVASWLSHRQADAPSATRRRPPLLPWFLLAFVALVALNSSGWLMPSWVKSGQATSQWLLVLAIAAIGMKTHPKEILAVGWRPMALMALETVFLAAVIYGGMRLLRV